METTKLSLKITSNSQMTNRPNMYLNFFPLPVLTVLFLASFLMLSCGRLDLEHSLPVEETVLKMGELIEFTYEKDRISFQYKSETKRIMQVSEKSAVLTMFPRPERWYGALGIYTAGEFRSPGLGARVVAQEAQLAFQTEDEFNKWWREQVYFQPLIGPEGLVVTYFKSPERDQINLDLWKVSIQGRVPVQTVFTGASGFVELVKM